LLLTELLVRGAAKAKQVMFSADGTRWIWNRADAQALGLAPNQLVKVADFYHAVEHLSVIADLCAGWSHSKRKRWVQRMRHLLEAGQIDKILERARGFSGRSPLA